MNLNPIKANMTELDLGNGTKVLFSYRTPVAARVDNGYGSGTWYQTEKKWSNTTTRHINKWMGEHSVFGMRFKPQEFFDNLISEVK